ncbi:MAG TPA: aminotransferase [Caulobacterales bacterium]|nr:aminotransferase [Caulobacterales bacterium]
MNPIFAALPTTIFERMSSLAREKNAINLGQGFPEIDGPEDVRAAAARAVLEGPNQYPPMLGLPELREAVAVHYERFHGLDLDWRSEVTITSGATEALAASIFALVSPGDEVVMFQPLYDAYEPLVRRAGGVLRTVRLTPPDWRFTEAMLAEAFSPRTKLVIFNNPLNPTGTVYSRDDLALLASFCVRSGAVVLSDEVWEHVVFDGREHVPLIGLPGMRERTVKIGSAGKIFSLTGWKVGFVCAAPALTAVIAKAHQFLTFSTPPNLQRAAAYGLGKDDDYFSSMRAALGASRDRLAAGLRAGGYHVLESGGTYFLCIDLPASGMALDDEEFCLRAVEDVGVAAIPVSAFYISDPVRSIVRLCFSKTDATIDVGVRRLAAFRERLK